MAGDELPIGVFDSGIGGLTVLRELHRRLPAEGTVYLGDTARVPYGTKSARVVTRYALNNARLLVQRGIKLLVVACNTASAVALEALEGELAIPVLGVIEPGARRAAAVSESGVVGVIGTEGTIASGSYQQALSRLRPELTVQARACPLFVPLVEEGWHRHPVAGQVAREYLQGWLRQDADTLILGCTHYPLLADAIAALLGDGVKLVDSASAVAAEVERLLDDKQLRTSARGGATREYWVTDVPTRFRRVGRLFLDEPIERVRLVDVDNRGDTINAINTSWISHPPC